MGISYDVTLETGSPERLQMLRGRIREAEEARDRAKAAGDSFEACRQKGNIAVWQHAIQREYGCGDQDNKEVFRDLPAEDNNEHGGAPE